MNKLEVYFWHMTRFQLAVPLLSNDVIKKELNLYDITQYGIAYLKKNE